MRAVRGAVLATALAATAAAGGAGALTDEGLRAALGVCLADGPGLAPRAERLAAEGWLALPPAARAEAAAALAPLQAVQIDRIYLPDGPPAPSADAAAAALAEARDRLGRAAAASGPRDLWFAWPDGAAYLRLFDPAGTGTGLACELAGPVPAEALAALLGAPLETHDFAPLSLTLLPAPAGAPGRVMHHAFAPGAFGAEAVAPAIVTPRVLAAD